MTVLVVKIAMYTLGVQARLVMNRATRQTGYSRHRLSGLAERT